MALEMVKDCVAFLVLLSGVFLAFGVTLIILLRPMNVVSHAAGADGWSLTRVRQPSASRATRGRGSLGREAP